MNVILCGFGFPAIGVLNYLTSRPDVTVTGVFTHNSLLHAPGLSDRAHDLGVWCTTESINTAEWIPSVDIIASVYYRTIIKQPVIDLVNGKIFNAHTSLLPKHRGRSPLSWAIIDGDQFTGVTFHYIDAGVDTGPILFQAAVEIAKNETLASLFDKINATVERYFPIAFELVKAEVKGIIQPGDGQHHKAGCPYNGEINPAWPPEMVDRFIRAMTYPPLPYARYNGQEIKTINDYLIAKNDQRYRHKSLQTK
jgi:methionyl-tRNA formyltransferase